MGRLRLQLSLFLLSGEMGGGGGEIRVDCKTWNAAVHCKGSHTHTHARTHIHTHTQTQTHIPDMGFFRRSADFRRLRGPTGHF